LISCGTSTARRAPATMTASPCTPTLTKRHRAGLRYSLQCSTRHGAGGPATTCSCHTSRPQDHRTPPCQRSLRPAATTRAGSVVSPRRHPQHRQPCPDVRPSWQFHRIGPAQTRSPAGRGFGGLVFGGCDKRRLEISSPDLRDHRIGCPGTPIPLQGLRNRLWVPNRSQVEHQTLADRV
jgi:hypothetical protein